MGLGPDAYAVIEQGRVGQILGSKPYELRAIIEEAAGVTKFKAKRKLAWAKLESSRQNLSRVNDILEEITRQLNSLKRQASKAERYGELREEMRAQLRVVLASHYRDKEQEAVRIALELGMRNRTLDERSALLEERESGQRQTHRLYEEEEADLRRSVEERSALRLNAERARSQSASQAQQIGYFSSRIEEAAAEKSRVEARAAELSSERTSCVSFLAEIQAEMETLAAELSESENRFQDIQANLKDKERNLTSLRQEMLEAVGLTATLRNQVQQLEEFLNATGRQVEQTERERLAVMAAEEAARARSGDLSAGMARNLYALEMIGGRRRSLEESLRTAREEELRLRAALEQFRSELSAQRGRIASLEEILERRAYSTETVKRLFESQHKSTAEGAVEAQGPSFEPVGVLADFIEVDASFERTVEEFLRQELDYIVVKDWSAAREGIRLLRSDVPGRATFLLHSGESSVAAHNGNGHSAGERIETLPGVIGPLESRVRLTNGFVHAAGSILPRLRNCYLVANVETARSLSAEHRDAYFLTPEGDWFHGDLVTAGKGDNSGPLALKRELRELIRSASAREEAASQTAEAVARLQATIEEQQAALTSEIEAQQEAEKKLVLAERDNKEASTECERLATHLQTIGLELERLRGESERARKRLAEDNAEIARREQRRIDIDADTVAITAEIAALDAAREEAHGRASESRSRVAALDERHKASAGALSRIERGIAEHAERLAELDRLREEWTRQKISFEESNLRLEREAAEAEQRSEALAVKVAEMERNYEQRRQRLAEMETELQVLRRELDEERSKKSAGEVQLARLESELSHLKESCRNELQVEMESLTAEPLPALDAEALAAAEENYQQLKRKIEGMGPINMMALEEYEECRQRHDFLDVQKQDLLDSIRDTAQAIEEIDDVSQKQFTEAFEQIDMHFQAMFKMLFGGGQGMLRLTEAENPADRGVEIIAQPPGKKLQSVLLLSGGEKALTALSLLLATFRYKPSPFCVLDEVDAPLDETNIGRFAGMVQQMSRDTQFIIITHSKRTMSVAPVLYGVTMEEPGVSKIVSVKFNGSSSPTVSLASPASASAVKTDMPALAEASV
jgi:chromosome segregation protein